MKTKVLCFIFCFLGFIHLGFAKTKVKTTDKKEAKFLVVSADAKSNFTTIYFKVETKMNVEPEPEIFVKKPKFRLVSITAKGKVLQSRYLDFADKKDECAGVTDCVPDEFNKVFNVKMRYYPDIFKVQLYDDEKAVAQIELEH